MLRQASSPRLLAVSRVTKSVDMDGVSASFIKGASDYLEVDCLYLSVGCALPMGVEIMSSSSEVRL